MTFLRQTLPLSRRSSCNHRRCGKYRIAVCLLCCLLGACATERYDPRPISSETVARSLNGHLLSSPALREFAQAHPRQPDEIWPPQKWDLGSLTLVAFFFNPDLEAARARLATAEAGQITAAQRPNPVLQFPLQWTANPKAGDSPWLFGFALDVPIETAGKRSYRVNEAAHLATASRFQVANVAWSIRNQLRQQLLAHWSASERAEFLQKQVELEQALLAIQEKRLKAGYAPPWEVNQQRLLLIQARNALLATQREAAATRVQVATVLGVRAEAVADIRLDLAGFGETIPKLPPQEIRLQALLNRTDVLEGLAQYEARQAAVQLEVAKQYPDLHLGPGYSLDQGANKVGFSFTGLTLPIFNRNQGPIAEARGRRLEAEARVKQLEVKAFSDADSAASAYDAAREMVAQNAEQLALQGRQLSAARRALELGQDDRMSLLLAQKAELAARLAMLDATVQLQQAVGKIEDAMQRPISDTPYPYPSSGLSK
jgi:outer membrane protein TolC